MKARESMVSTHFSPLTKARLESEVRDSLSACQVAGFSLLSVEVVMDWK